MGEVCPALVRFIGQARAASGLWPDPYLLRAACPTFYREPVLRSVIPTCELSWRQS